MSNIAVSTSNLTKSFNGHKSVDNLSLSIPQGCIYGLLGPNGAGKTTTIRMLLGLIRPDGGDVHIFGQNLSFYREAILKNVGSLIETPSYYANLNAWENLKIICMMKQINTDEINPILDLVGLQNCGKKRWVNFPWYETAVGHSRGSYWWT
ncbi:ATP-binding cassette domain-containing protein [Ruminiclostridium josui]|uniref:ATP-binding cassette domain-containing protein n=1 Tax=Ruminiclostridium josui TaxID=1499 RepID=UPI0009EBDA44|nr:ATP-binding cassette domain-containing protein [Ruminiclostridium josui]